MAVDEYLIAYFEKTGQPVLRLYGWDPAGISAGKNQNVRQDIDLDKCKKESVPIVRRMTGGSAIFHRDEATYSIVCSEKDLSDRNLSVKGSFEKLNSFIIAMYGKFGLQAAYAGEGAHSGIERRGIAAFCFASNEEYDILIKGKKIGGNAQSRKKEIIFQHGSIPLKSNPDALQYFRQKEDCATYTDLGALLGREVRPEEVCAALAASFAATFSCTLEEQPLSPDEEQEVALLVSSKYGADSWNMKV
jgi:lipoyl(octanoyl) transferase